MSLRSAPGRLPFTLFFVAVMVVSNWFAGTLGGALPPASLQAWGLSLETLLQGELFRLLTATFLSHSFAMFLRQFLFATCVIGFYEWHQGSLRAILMFLSIDIVGTLLTFALVIMPMTRADDELAALADVGMSAGGFGLIGALCRLSAHPILFLALTTAAIAVKIMFDFDVIADSAHMLCLLLGFALQAFVSRSASEKGPRQ